MSFQCIRCTCNNSEDVGRLSWTTQVGRVLRGHALSGARVGVHPALSARLASAAEVQSIPVESRADEVCDSEGPLVRITGNPAGREEVPDAQEVQQGGLLPPEGGRGHPEVVPWGRAAREEQSRDEAGSCYSHPDQDAGLSCPDRCR